MEAENKEMDVRTTDRQGADWIQLALGRVQWQAFGNMILNM